MFDEVDLIVSPTSTAAAPILTDVLKGELLQEIPHWHSPFWSPYGCPVAALPIGFDGSGTPLGVQVAAKPFDDRGVIHAGVAFQHQTDWHRFLPPLLDADQRQEAL